MELMRERRIEETIPEEIVRDGCLLCSEDQPHHCHRRACRGISQTGMGRYGYRTPRTEKVSKGMALDQDNRKR